MAVRTPLRMWNGNIREMTTQEIDHVVARIASKYHESPATLLYVDAAFSSFQFQGENGSGFDTNDYAGEINVYASDLLPSLANGFNNIYYTTGTAATSVSSYPGETSTGEPVKQKQQYGNPGTDGVLEYGKSFGLTAPADTDNKKYPLFWNNGNLQCMTLDDVLDTFIFPAFDYVAGVYPRPATAAEDQPGAYKVIGKSGTGGDVGEGVAPPTPSGFTRIGTVPFYRDWFADQSAYPNTAVGTIGTSGTTQNYYEYVEYWLFRKNHPGTYDNFADGGTAIPLHMTPGSNIADHNLQEKDVDDLTAIMKYYANGDGGTGTRRLTYQIVDATTTTLDILGSIMNNSTVDTTGQAGTLYNRFVNTNDYRSQEFPMGTIITEAQYALVLNPNDLVH